MSQFTTKTSSNLLLFHHCHYHYCHQYLFLVIFVVDDVYDSNHYEFSQMLYLSSFLVRSSKFNKQQQQQQQQQCQKCFKKENSPLFVCQIWRYVLCFLLTVLFHIFSYYLFSFLSFCFIFIS